MLVNECKCNAMKMRLTKFKYSSFCTNFITLFVIACELNKISFRENEWREREKGRQMIKKNVRLIKVNHI
jgi:hypothetical protein